MQPVLLTARFKVLTPLFLGDAEQQPDLRAPSLKGVLRFWYRAIDPEFERHESQYFGGQSDEKKSSAGQSPFLLQIESTGGEDYPWTRQSPGITYLGYPFGLKSNSGPRRAIAPGTEFTLNIRVLRQAHDERFRQALSASLWCLGHIGALGSRNRRGFGALALTDWTFSHGEAWSELNKLPLLAGEETPHAWLTQFEQFRKQIKEWFGPFEGPVHQPHLGNHISRRLQAAAFNNWQDVLERMGSKFQQFRQRRDPDYSDVKKYLNTQKEPLFSPQRAVFGLPLTVQYRSLGGKRVEFTPMGDHKRLERHGSLLLLRPIEINQKLYPFYLKMQGDLPGRAPLACIRATNRTLPAPNGNLMDDFMDWLVQEGSA